MSEKMLTASVHDINCKHKASFDVKNCDLFYSEYFTSLD